jgi:1,4-dihydroxy-2-naphthoyl-CoA hydrolase
LFFFKLSKMEVSSKADQLNILCKNTLVDHLGIEFISAVEGEVVARMPVDNRTIQPFKILHGGASLALAETLASAGSAMLVDLSGSAVVGVEVNGNHVGSATSGFVVGTATIVHQGKQTHVWNIEIVDETKRKIMIGRVTVMVIIKKNQIN